MSVKKYRKLPVVIEAIQFTGKNAEALRAFCPNVMTSYDGNADKIEQADIPTLEGLMAVDIGDYVIRGVAGEHYPCKPDIFAATYELADEPAIEPSGMNFGQAIHALKLGEKVAREGWNGKGMFLFLLPAGTIPKAAIHDPKLREVLEGNGKDSFEALASIRMMTADGKILTGWLASQTDMLAEDWVIVD